MPDPMSPERLKSVKPKYEPWEVPMFVLEVPTTYGCIRVVGPATATKAEARTLAATVSRVLKLLVLDPDIPLGVSVDETRKVAAAVGSSDMPDAMSPEP